MQSIREIYRIGVGPSSSHTMGPKAAAEAFLADYPQATSFRVTLYASLAATGRGHLTDQAILSVLGAVAPTSICWKPDIVLPEHPNALRFEALSHETVIAERVVFSVGGGAIVNQADFQTYKKANSPVYDMTHMTDILSWCTANGRSYWEYVELREGPDIWNHLKLVWETMQAAVRRGIETEGRLPGPLNIPRKAASFYIKAKAIDNPSTHSYAFAYALGVSEENASGGVVVTAPTCGACGVLPAVLYHYSKVYGFSEQRILRALATAGLIGNLAKYNASISGAEAGCQAEVGVACSMAAAAACQLMGGTPSQIEYAAEMGLEHHLGMTCDPVGGLVQIPCIERNAYAATRALDASLFSNFSDGVHRVSFDHVLEVMRQTGHDLPSLYRETSRGGLAKSIPIQACPLD